MESLKTATANFMAQVERNTPTEAKRIRTVLDDLIRWSEDHVREVSFSGQGTKGLIRCYVDGIDAPFWVVTPRLADGAKLTLLPSAHTRFPEDLREEARQVCARIDHRAVKSKEVPEVSCAKLLWAPHRDTMFGLLTRVLNRICEPMAEELVSA